MAASPSSWVLFLLRIHALLRQWLPCVAPWARLGSLLSASGWSGSSPGAGNTDHARPEARSKRRSESDRQEVNHIGAPTRRPLSGSYARDRAKWENVRGRVCRNSCQDNSPGGWERSAGLQELSGEFSPNWRIFGQIHDCCENEIGRSRDIDMAHLLHNFSELPKHPAIRRELSRQPKPRRYPPTHLGNFPGNRFETPWWEVLYIYVSRIMCKFLKSTPWGAPTSQQLVSKARMLTNILCSGVLAMALTLELLCVCVCLCVEATAAQIGSAARPRHEKNEHRRTPSVGRLFRAAIRPIKLRHGHGRHPESRSYRRLLAGHTQSCPWCAKLFAHGVAMSNAPGPPTGYIPAGYTQGLCRREAHHPH